MECHSIKDLALLISILHPGDWLIVDVDDTLIAPKAMMFRPESPYYGFIDNLKKSSHKYLTEILSTWRLNRKVLLVEPEWPKILKQLQDQGVIVLALTQMNSGKFGIINSMEKWRTDELEKLGLVFSPFTTASEVETIIEHDEPATLYKGILFTGSHTKSETLRAFIAKYNKPTRIVFIDDRLAQVESIGKLCEEIKVPYHGYHYLGVTRLPYNSSKDCGAIQTEMIINYQWAEDEEACMVRNDKY